MNIRFYVDRSDYSIVVDGRITGEERVRIPSDASKDDRHKLEMYLDTAEKTGRMSDYMMYISEFMRIAEDMEVK